MPVSDYNRKHTVFLPGKIEFIFLLCIMMCVLKIMLHVSMCRDRSLTLLEKSVCHLVKILSLLQQEEWQYTTIITTVPSSSRTLTLSATSTVSSTSLVQLTVTEIYRNIQESRTINNNEHI